MTSRSLPRPPSARARLKRLRSLGVAALVPLGALGLTCFDPPFAQRALPPRSDAALVLSGDVDYRRLERAAALYHEGRVDVLVLTGSGIGGDSALAMRELAAGRLGVPAEAILVEPRSTTTRENLVFATELLRQNRLKSVALVTSASHMGRALLAARRAAPEANWIPVPVADVGPPSRVWRTRFVEWFKLAWYWLHGWA